MPNHDPADLLRRFAATGDEPAFRALVERFLPLVYSAALRQVGGNITLAEDAAQEVFIALARKASALAERPTPAPWLFHAARLAALRLLRREQRRLERETRACLMEPPPDTSAPPDWERLRPLLDSLLRRLPRPDQEALFLRYFEARSFAEIGRRLGIGEDGARQRSHRALDKLNALLAQRGLTTGSAVLASVLATHCAGAVPAGLGDLVARGALAASAAGSGAAFPAVFLSVMKLSPSIAGSILLLVAAGIGSALYVARATRAGAPEIASLRAERTALRAELAALRSRAPFEAAPASPAAAPAPSASSPPAPAAPGALSAAPAAAPSPVDELRDRIDHVLAHPDLQPAFVAHVVRQLAGDQRRFFRLIGLTPEQEAAVAREAADYARTLLRARAERIGGDHFAEAFAAADDHSFRQVQRILGDEAFARLKELRAMSREYATADQLAARLYVTDTPLEGPQADRIARILAAHRFGPATAPSAPPPTVGGRPVAPADHAAFRAAQNTLPADSRTVLITDAALAAAAGVLPVATIAALTDLQARQIALLRLQPPR